MTEFLADSFALVCGQTPERTWAPGGEMLPFCQRCAGLYVGACLALALQLICRIQSGPRWLAVYGLLMLQMLPSVLHLVPDRPILRTISGMLFSFGEVGFLWLLPERRFKWGRPTSVRTVWLVGVVGAAGVVCVSLTAATGGVVAAAVLSWLGFAGFLSLVLLVVGNVVLCAAWLITSLRQRKT